MNTNDKVRKMLSLMKNNHIDVYIIPTLDPHQSEYVAEHFQSRKWISGFTGSAGTVLLSNKGNGLWTDSRYFLQAEKELEVTDIKLYKSGEPDVPVLEDWILKSYKEGCTIGFDGRLFSAKKVEQMGKKFGNKFTIKTDCDLINEIWEDRPSLPKNKIYIHDVKYSGKSVKDKMNLVRNKIKEYKGDYYITASLDNISWLYNLRGADIENNPVFLSYAIIGLDNAYLFIDNEKIDKDVNKYLVENNIIINDYNKIIDFIMNIENKKIVYDPSIINYHLVSYIPKKCKQIKIDDIIIKLKAVKNDIEIKNLIKCYNRDNIAMVKFIYWLTTNVDKGDITELTVADKLYEYRSQLDLFRDISFETIAGYQDHGAIVHYSASEKTSYTLKPEGFILIDSGGQYLDGTTDITRTISLGSLTNEQKKDFTLVLKGVIALSKIKFLYGTNGSNIDILAKQFLWENGLDYKHGTGHGIGFFLNVHEGPQRISPYNSNVVFEKGMVTSNEPGLYKKGKHGIRIENAMYVDEYKETEFGKFMQFNTLTYCPIDLNAIVVEMLTKEEKDWLNAYHKKTYDIISPYLEEDEKLWLKNATKEI